MKIIFCGPPQSGKSVFIANLIDEMPTDDYTIIRANPDGEGSWSNNPNQKETAIIRQKGKFTKSFVDRKCQEIDNQSNSIVLVDVGGVISPENEQIFKHCDSFVVLSNDEQKKQEWLEFGQRLGLKCVGLIDSSLEGEEAIYSKDPYIQGRIVGLIRGRVLKDSKMLEAIAWDIVKRSKYVEKTEKSQAEFEGTMIDDTELGFELGYGKEILTEDGIPIKKVRWPESAIPDIYQAVQERVDPEQPVKINGIRANFVLCAICKATKQKGAKDVSAYDIRTKSYIPIRNLPKKKGLKQTEGLSYSILENKENVFMDIDITKEQYSLEDYEYCVLPQIKEGKNLYLSGRMPLWLLASISSSYDASKIFTFQPGKGFSCISSIDEKDLGTIVDGVDGININQYFEDKKDKSKTKLPAVVEKQGFLSKLKGWFANFREKRENAKYLDDTIRASTVVQATIPDKSSSPQSTFQEQLSQGIHKEVSPEVSLKSQPEEPYPTEIYKETHE
ncbi:MAG: ATP-binding protein [Clostridia bacterium]